MYDLALKAIEAGINEQPEAGTPESKLLEELALAVSNYEDVMFPIFPSEARIPKDKD